MSLDWPSILQALPANLLSEFIGMVFTVFLVERIVDWTLKRQEAKRLKPSKDILYAKLTRQLYRFLMVVAPVRLKKELKAENGLTQYFYYGNVLCPIPSFFQKEDHSSLRGYYQRSEPTSLRGYSSGVEQLRADLERTIDTSAFLMEPVLLTDCFELLENLNDFMKLKMKPEADPREVKIEVLSYSVVLAKSVETAINLMNTLLTKATNK